MKIKKLGLLTLTLISCVLIAKATIQTQTFSSNSVHRHHPFIVTVTNYVQGDLHIDAQYQPADNNFVSLYVYNPPNTIPVCSELPVGSSGDLVCDLTNAPIGVYKIEFFNQLGTPASCLLTVTGNIVP